MQYSQKGLELISMYKEMSEEGYQHKLTGTIESNTVDKDFELSKVKDNMKDIFTRYNIKTVLDYGSGGSNWTTKGFSEEGKTATEYFNVDKVFYFEPARNLDERAKVDCVISFDVLEHIFVSDIPNVLSDMFSYASKLVVLNVACYQANALLPNGENAHVTVRHPWWWKGMVDNVAMDFPEIEVWLLTSIGYGRFQSFPIFAEHHRHTDKRYVIDY